jgi:hypothetical protein
MDNEPTHEFNFSDQSCQTDEDLIYNYAWISKKKRKHFLFELYSFFQVFIFLKEFYHHFQTHAANNIKSEQNIKAQTEESSGQLDSNSIREIAESSLESKGLIYNSTSGLYYDTQNALYYDQVYKKTHPNHLVIPFLWFKFILKSKKLYIDIENWIYYHYVVNEQSQSYHLRYHSKIRRHDRKKLNKNIMQTSEEKAAESKKEVIYLDSTSEGEIRSDEDEDESREEIIDLTTKYPPCIRAILVGYTQPKNESESDECEHVEQQLGSLYLIPYTGGSIGRSLKNLISFPKCQSVSESHAVVAYDMTKKAYFIQGICNSFKY